jgi:hypothetical protein
VKLCEGRAWELMGLTFGSHALVLLACCLLQVISSNWNKPVGPLV